MHLVSTLKFWLLYLSVFTLPMFMHLNNYVLGGFIFLGFLDMAINRPKIKTGTLLTQAWPVLAFFGLALLACLRTPDLEGFRDLERFWSFLLVPLVFLSDPFAFSDRRRNLFLSLTYGCLATLLICYGNVFWQMYSGGQPLYTLFESKYVGFRFTEVADTHPAYLGLFILTAIVFLLRDQGLPKTDKLFHILLLMLGLFQLAGRTTILLFLAMFILLLFWGVKQYKWQIPVLVLGLLLITAAFMNYRSPYMQKRLFSLEAYTNEYRTERWKVSFDIFRENPVFGVGYKQVRVMRKQLYADRGLPFGQDGDYNAHNQFLEYLSTNGALGGFVYVVCMAFLLLSSLYYGDRLYVYIFAAFLIANMTESMLVRIKGIEYFAIFASLFLSTAFLKDREAAEPTDGSEMTLAN